MPKQCIVFNSGSSHTLAPLFTTWWIFAKYSVTLEPAGSSQPTALSSEHSSAGGKAGLWQPHTHTHTRVIWSACPAECSSIPEAAAARFVLYHPCCRLQTYNTKTHTHTHTICEHRFMHQLNWKHNTWFYFSFLQYNEFFHLHTSGYINCMYTTPQSISISSTILFCTDNRSPWLLRLQQPRGITAELVFLQTAQRHTQFNTQRVYDMRFTVSIHLYVLYRN